MLENNSLDLAGCSQTLHNIVLDKNRFETDLDCDLGQTESFSLC